MVPPTQQDFPGSAVLLARWQALCAEASLAALRRVYPQIYTSDVKLLIDVSAVRVTRADFTAAMKGKLKALSDERVQCIFWFNLQAAFKGSLIMFYY